MKRILIIIFCLLFLVGCSNSKKDASFAVLDYMNKYQTIDSDIEKQIDEYANKYNYDDKQKKLYKSILERQFKDLNYKIINEVYEKNNATVDLRIVVYDLYQVQKEATNYYNEHASEFNDEKGNFLENKFLDYKLSKMQNVNVKTDYTIEFFVSKKNGKWVVANPSKIMLEKIHGIYNYDNK